MAYKLGSVICRLSNIMGMPTDVGECEVCGEKHTTWGDSSWARLEEWAKQHSEEHEGRAV